MNLEELYKKTKSKAIILIDKNGEIVKSYSDVNYERAEDFSAVTMVVSNMLDSFFAEVLLIKPLTEMIIKTEKHHFYITKCDANHVLCVLSDSAINTSLISLSLKKINFIK
ncbi:roadblock/LC7 domain-containing protein [Tenacibaculum soleae]|uniref:roadblock/LC7 domain-containing protein n=1 Tax=Tenacibaculum soleae TaxID=447689 RepID=UPI0026E29636|nr:roadblock/LC7 domain-containing protein [Tenacibaculum soleae]MDO6744345.1 roadblock/LC7 domain-containing protein [Tenacibaculum soleae]